MLKVPQYKILCGRVNFVVKSYASLFLIYIDSTYNCFFWVEGFELFVPSQIAELARCWLPLQTENRSDHAAQVAEIVGDELVSPRVYEEDAPRPAELNFSKILESEEYALFTKYIRPYCDAGIPMDAAVERAEPQPDISARNLIQMYRRKS